MLYKFCYLSELFYILYSDLLTSIKENNAIYTGEIIKLISQTHKVPWNFKTIYILKYN